MSLKIAFLDSCVLYPYSIRDILMQYAVEGLYQAKWSTKVENEFVKNIEKNNPRSIGKLLKTVEAMRTAVPDHIAEPSREMLKEVSTSKTDRKDLEILAATINGKCTHLVTFNLKDFDISYASAKAVAVIHPDEFIYSLIQYNPQLARDGFKKAVKRFRKPLRSEKEYCETLRKNHLSKTAEELENILSL